MHLYERTPRYGKPVRVINAGGWYVSDKDELLLTILGSCVSVCIHDQAHGISGMNHFMLPGRISRVDIFSDRVARYGITAMRNLLDELEGRGARRQTMKAMVFGGATVMEAFADYTEGDDPIPQSNVRIARLLLEMEDIPLVSSDTGGVFTRKVFMDVISGKVYLQRSGPGRIEDAHPEKKI